MSVLNEIFAHKRLELAKTKGQIAEADLEAQAADRHPPPDFFQCLSQPRTQHPHLIAEVKHRSPSKGVLSQDFDPLRLASVYRHHGAAAISVLTDESYFGGHLDFLRDISIASPEIPLLRKDFIFDRYQLLEARAAGASAALLITAMLEDQLLATLIQFSEALQLTPLVEIHTAAEFQRANDAGAKVIGINNRDLHTFEVSLETTLNLLPQRPPGVLIIAESGIKSAVDARRLAEAGADAMLIGEGLVTAPDIAAAVRDFSLVDGVN